MQELIKRYTWVTDEGCFYDKQRRLIVPEQTVINKAVRSMSLDAAQKLMESMKIAGVTKAELKPPKLSVNSLVEASYESVRHALPLMHFSAKANQSFYIIDKHKQVTAMGDLDADKFVAALMGRPEIIDALKEGYYEQAELTAKISFAAYLNQIFLHFKTDTSRQLASEPALLSWDPDEPAFKKLSRDILREGSTDNWDSFVDRTDYPEIFKAFLWSVFEPTNFGRQVLWLQGEGSDGKSSVLNALATFMGRDHVLSIGKGSYNESFFFGEAYGKRLAFYMDCKNLQILRAERIKSLVGKDTVNINNKYEKQFSGQVYARLLVASNYLPQINYNDDSERTRLLLVRVSKYKDEFGDPDFEQNLVDELPAFLLKCQKSYAENCPKNTNLRVPREMAEGIKLLCSASDSALLEQFVAEKLEFGEQYYVNKLELRNLLKDYFAKNWANSGSDFSEHDLARMLVGKYKCTVNEGLKAYEGVRIIGSNKQIKKEQKNV